MINAAVWAAKNSCKKILNEAGLRIFVRKRIEASGPNQEDKQSLLAWRADQVAVMERNLLKQQNVAQELAKESSAAAKVAEIDNAISDFELLEKFKREVVWEEFSSYFFTHNSLLYRLFRKNGLKATVVRAEFARFIADGIP